jgi:DNA-binding MarR family transcriptional regulator
LEQRGLLRRGADPADRRNRIVELTESGRVLVAQCQDGIRRMERDLLADLPDADRDSFIGLLERVAELVARRRPGS